MKKYQIWGFNFIPSNVNNEKNLITGTREKSESEFNVACFDGVAFFKSMGRYYITKYPKYRRLNSYTKEKVRQYCGYYPKSGEYGVIMGAIGITIECDEKTFYDYYKNYSIFIKKEDNKLLKQS